MLNLQVLNQLLSDQALRTQVSRIIANKIKADVQSLEANAELSRRLIEAGRRSLRAGMAAAPAGETMLKQVVQEHLDYYETLVNMTLAFNQRLLDTLRRPEAANGGEAGRRGALAMELAAPLHATVRAPFRLANNRAAPITVSFEATPFVSEDGSQLVSAEAAFDPPAIELAPGQEAKVDFILPVARGFTPGATYFSTISAVGMTGMQIVVRLKVEAPAAEAPAPPPAAVAEAPPPVEGADLPPAEPPPDVPQSAEAAPTKRRRTTGGSRRKRQPGA